MPKVRAQQINYPYLHFSGNTGSDTINLGRGITFYGSSGISVTIIDEISYIGIQSDTTENSSSISYSTSGLKSATLFVENFNVSITGSTIHDTGINITNTPAGNGYISLSLNGLNYIISDTTLGPFFFGTNSATTISHELVSSGDTLYYNPLTKGFNLTIDDEIILNYMKIN